LNSEKSKIRRVIEVTPILGDVSLCAVKGCDRPVARRYHSSSFGWIGLCFWHEPVYLGDVSES